VSFSLPRPLHVLNEGLAFVLEMVMLVALCAWAWSAASTPPGHVLLAAAAAIVVGAIWGTFASPKARIRLPLAGILAVKVALFLLAGAAIDALVGWAAAIAFATIAIVNAGVAELERASSRRR
jgi:hypothetical protein